MPAEVSAIEYHDRTKHSPESVRTSPGLDFQNKPSPDKAYLDLPRTSLPTDPADPGTPALAAIAVDRPAPPRDEPFPASPPNEIDRETLAQLCHYAAGITKELSLQNREMAFRAAACTGALYHIDLYPVAGELADLPAGVYHFDPRDESLDVLREGDYRAVLARAADDDRIRTAPVTFVTTSTWWRNAWKYRERTYRHTFWDSGTTIANLLAVAHARGLPASVVLGFADEPVVELLGLDPSEEAPVELVPVGADDRAPDAPSVSAIDPSTEPLSPDPRSYPAIPQAWRAGILSDGATAATWRTTAQEAAPIGHRPPGDGKRVSLDPVDRQTASARPLGNAIDRRGSCREFVREPLSFRKVSTVLDRAMRGSPIDSRSLDGSPLQFVDCYLIVNAVEGLDAGVYQVHSDRSQLERLRAGTFRREAGRLALGQQLGADAAVCLYFMADLPAITDELGDRGYRIAQFEAALTAGRLYLATYAHRSLGGTGLTFFDDHVTEFLSPRAAGQTPMFLYTLGRPA